VALSKTKKRIAQYLYCTNILQENVATALRKLRQQNRKPPIRPMLLFTSYHSLKHPKTLRKPSQNITETEPTLKPPIGYTSTFNNTPASNLRYLTSTGICRRLSFCNLARNSTLSAKGIPTQPYTYFRHLHTPSIYVR
jgi:hypothetical protein